MLFIEHCRDALVRRRTVVDQQNTAMPTGVRYRLALRILNADLFRRDSTHAQLVSHHFQARQRAHARDQRHVRYRFGQKVVGAGIEPAHAIRRLIELRHHHHRDMVGGGVALELAADLKAVQPRHHDVEQHHLALRALTDRQRIAAVHGGENVEIFRRKPGLEQLDVGSDVVDDKDACGHWRPPSTVPRKWRMVSMNLPTEIGFDK